MDKIEILSEGGKASEVEMETKELHIAGKKYTVFIADTEEAREEGLQNVSDLPKDQGMLFVFEEPTTAAFWMKDTLIPLDIIYIDEYGDVKAVMYGEPLNEEISEVADIKYVLELNADSGVTTGDEIDLAELGLEDEDIDYEEDEDEKTIMSVLDENGESQMDLKGGERIFSRPNTKTLISLAKRAYKSKTEKDYKALGKRVFKYLDIQNNKEEDYIDLPG